jgi:hypothetical protein
MVNREGLRVKKLKQTWLILFASIGIAFVVANAYLVWEGNRLLRLETELYKNAKVDFTVIKPLSVKRLEPLSMQGPDEIKSPTRSWVQLVYGKTCCPDSDSFNKWRKEIEYKFEFLSKLSTRDGNYGQTEPERSSKHIQHEFERLGRHQARRITIFEGSEVTARLEAVLPLEALAPRTPNFVTFLAINHPFTNKPTPVDISHLTGKIDEFFNKAIVGKRGPLDASSNEPEKVLAVYEPTSADITNANLAVEAALNDPRCKETIARTKDYYQQPVFKLLNDSDKTSVRLVAKSSIYCVGPLIIVFEKLPGSGAKTVKILSTKGDLKRQVLSRQDQQIARLSSNLGRLVIDPTSFVFEDGKLRWRYLGYRRLNPDDTRKVDTTAIKQILEVEIAMGAPIE